MRINAEDERLRANVLMRPLASEYVSCYGYYSVAASLVLIKVYYFPDKQLFSIQPG